MIQTLLIVTVLVGLAFLGLGFNIFFRKKLFPETELGKNKNMKALGLSCAKCDEMRRFREMKRFKNVSIDFSKVNF